MRLSELPSHIDATVLRDAEFHNLGFLFDDLPDRLIFVESRRFVPAARTSTGLRCVLCTPELVSSFPEAAGLAFTSEPRLAFFQLQRFVVEETEFYWEPFASEIHPSATIHPRAWIAPQNVRIGPETVVHANAVIGEHSLIGASVQVQAGAILGSEGFQTAQEGDGLIQMLHGGGILVQDHAVIFANAVIARGVFRQMTSLGKYVRIGNGAFVSHNVRVGDRTFIGHNATINGNTTIGDDAWIGPNATISNLLHIGDRAEISLGAVVIRSVPAGTRITGMTAIEHRRMLRHVASLR